MLVPGCGPGVLLEYRAGRHGSEGCDGADYEEIDGCKRLGRDRLEETGRGGDTAVD